VRFYRYAGFGDAVMALRSIYLLEKNGGQVYRYAILFLGNGEMAKNGE